MSDQHPEQWVIAWIENYHENNRIEPRWCADVEEAVELSLMWEESDDHCVTSIETQAGELSTEEEQQVEQRVRAKWAAEAEVYSASRLPITHFVDARVAHVIPKLSDDWRIWGPVARCRSEDEAQKAAAKWIEAIGTERVRIRPARRTA